VADNRISIMLIGDCIYSGLLCFYIIFIVLRLIIFSWTSSRLEARTHMRYFVIVSVSLGLSLPLVINDLLMFEEQTEG